MTITITLSPEIEQKLVERASRRGEDAQTTARDILERGLNAEPTFDEILAPFRQDVAASSLADQELDALFEEAREEVSREKARKTL